MLLSCLVESTHPFAARVVDSRPSVLLHPSGGYNCLTRYRLQMFLNPQVCVEYGNRTREHQSGHQSSYWLWTSVLNFSERELVSNRISKRNLFRAISGLTSTFHQVGGCKRYRPGDIWMICGWYLDTIKMILPTYHPDITNPIQYSSSQILSIIIPPSVII